MIHNTLISGILIYRCKVKYIGLDSLINKNLKIPSLKASKQSQKESTMKKIMKIEKNNVKNKT